MSIGFVLFIVILSLTTPSVIEVSVCNGVDGHGCLISSSMILIYAVSRTMMYSAANSALVVDDITCSMMWTILSRDLLLVVTYPPFG